MRSRKYLQLLRIATAASLMAWVSTPQQSLAVRADHSAPRAVEDTHAAEVDPSIVAVEVTRTGSAADVYFSPTAKSWTTVVPCVVPLFPQTLATPNGGGSTRDLTVRAAETNEGMVFRLEWSDPTQDDGRKGNSFKDAIAMEFPIEEAGETRLAMGHNGGPVNILYWSADTSKVKGTQPKQAMELVSAGIYSRTPKPDAFQKLQSSANWRNQKWTVVIFKPFNAEDKSSPKFGPGTDIPIAFAVWNGGAGERLGLKSVSNWNVLHCK